MAQKPRIKTHLTEMLREADTKAWADVSAKKRSPTDPALGLEGEAANEIERMQVRFVRQSVDHKAELEATIRGAAANINKLKEQLAEAKALLSKPPEVSAETPQKKVERQASKSQAKRVKTQKKVASKK